MSASTARKVHIIDTATGKVVGSFASGDQPHETNYSRDGAWKVNVGEFVLNEGADCSFIGRPKTCVRAEAQTSRPIDELVRGMSAQYAHVRSALRVHALNCDHCA